MITLIMRFIFCFSSKFLPRGLFHYFILYFSYLFFATTLLFLLHLYNLIKIYRLHLASKYKYKNHFLLYLALNFLSVL